MKRIAVLGAGLAGLSVSWYLLQKGHAVTLFDPGGTGAGASGASTGLLHLYVGKEAKKSWEADRAYEESLALFEIAEEALGAPVCQKSGLLRLAVTPQQKKDFLRLCQEAPNQVHWWEEERVQNFLPKAAYVPAVWDPQAVTVFSKKYLEGLLKACQKKGLLFLSEKISSLEELQFSQDAVIVATGAHTPLFAEMQGLSVMQTKGQALLCRSSHRLPCALLSQGHLTPTPDPFVYQIGSTYERKFIDWKPEAKKAEELIEQAAQFYPPVRDFQVIEMLCGVRLSPKVGYRPFWEQVLPKIWVFTGLGSRGLLYHAWLGKELAEKVSLS